MIHPPNDGLEQRAQPITIFPTPQDGGATAAPDYRRRYPRTVNHVAAVSRSYPPSMGAEDFSYYDFNDDALPIGASFFARLAERFLAGRD